MSEQFGRNFAPGSFALQQSIRLVYTLRALSRGRNRATRATRENQKYTHTERAHARQWRHNTKASPRLRRGAGRCCCRAATAAAAAAAAATVLLLLLLLCCCCAAVVLLVLHDPRCIAEHKPSQQTVSRFVFFGTHAGASNGTAEAAAVVATVAAAAAAQQQQQEQVRQQGRPKHMYEYTPRHQAG